MSRSSVNSQKDQHETDDTKYTSGEKQTPSISDNNSGSINTSSNKNYGNQQGKSDPTNNLSLQIPDLSDLVLSLQERDSDITNNLGLVSLANPGSVPGNPYKDSNSTHAVVIMSSDYRDSVPSYQERDLDLTNNEGLKILNRPTSVAYNKENDLDATHSDGLVSPDHSAVGSYNQEKDSTPVDSALQKTDPPDLVPIQPPSAKDGGYGWVIVFMVFLVNVVLAGYVKSIGITYTLILDYFPETSGAASGWIMGLLVGCRGLAAPVMGALTVTIGPRKCIMIGTIICVTGLLLAVPAFSVSYLAFTLGGLVGAGICMAETPGYIVVTDYFEEKRTLANGFRAAGNPMGGVLFAPLVVLLNNNFGLRGTFIILAGIVLQLAVVAMFIRPFEVHKRIIEDKYWAKKEMKSLGQDQNTLRLKATADKQQMIEKKKKMKKPLDFTLLKNPAYLVYLLTVLCTSAALPSALLLAPAYGRSVGLNDYQNSLIASYTSICDFVMRILSGFIFSNKKIKKKHGFISGMLIGGVGCLIVPLCTEMWHLLIFGTMLSLCMAFYWSLVNSLLADQFGADAMASSWGFFRMFVGICNFFYPSVLGFVKDKSGGFTYPYIMMGLLQFAGALVYSLQPLFAKLPGSKVNFS